MYLSTSHADSGRKCDPPHCCISGESHGQRRLTWGHKQLDTNKQIAHTHTDWEAPIGSNSKEICLQCRGPEFNLGWERSLRRRNSHPPKGMRGA